VCCLLQVQYIVSCIAASEYLGSDTKLDDWAFSQWDISALFGSVPLNHKGMKKGKVNGMPPTVFNKVTQVCVVFYLMNYSEAAAVVYRTRTKHVRCWCPTQVAPSLATSSAHPQTGSRPTAAPTGAAVNL
jgi:hypothetical protein